jgi:hypothetical protein
MAIQIPQSPTLNQEFFAAGKLYVWNETAWRRAYTYAIIDGGFSITEVSGESSTADGGNA